MSMESAKAFIERMNTDAEFAKKAMEQRGKEQIAAFLKEEGYEFSEEEYKEAVKVNGEELSDERLDNVAGGEGNTCLYTGDCGGGCSSICAWYC